MSCAALALSAIAIAITLMGRGDWRFLAASIVLLLLGGVFYESRRRDQ